MKLLSFGHLDRVTNLGINMYFSILFICFLFVFFLSGESCNDQRYFFKDRRAHCSTVSQPCWNKTCIPFTKLFYPDPSCY